MIKNTMNLHVYNVKISTNHKNILFIFIIICLILLLFRKKINIHIERMLLLFMIFSLLLILTRNWFYTILGTIILFGLFNLMMNMQKTKSNMSYENFDNKKEDVDKNIEKIQEKKEEIKEKLGDNDILQQITQKIKEYESDKDVQKAAGGLQNLLKQLDGGIELKDSDTKETKPMNVDIKEYSDNKKEYPMKKAQQEVYELVDSMSALKDAMETLAPVLSQGKEIMGMFENFKL